mgnify:CR=1 FL=1
MNAADEKLAELTEEILAKASQMLLCSDFDGTLAPIVADPMAARPVDGAIDVLRQLSEHVKALAIVTGRDVRTVHRLAGLDALRGRPNVFAIGQYGVERWQASTDQFEIPEQPESIKAAIADIDELLAKANTDESAPDLAGVHIEDKQLAVGVHTRRAADPTAALNYLDPDLRDIAERHDLHAEPGKFVLELRAATLTKGDAVQSLIDDLQPQVLIFMGDDLGDLAAFDVLDRWRADGKTAVKIAVASDEQPRIAQRADVVFADPAALVAWLSQIAGELAQR